MYLNFLISLDFLFQSIYSLKPLKKFISNRKMKSERKDMHV